MRVIYCFVVSAIVIVGLRAATKIDVLSSAEKTNRGLVISDDDLSVGPVFAKGDFQWRVALRNTASQPVAVEGIHASCSCTQVMPRSFHLKPGESRELTLEIDLFQLFDDPFASNVDTYVHFRPHFSKGSTFGPGWKLRLAVQRPIIVVHSTVDAGMVAPRRPDSLNVPFWIWTLADVEDLNASSSSSLVTFSHRASSLVDTSDGKVFKHIFDATISNDTPIGPFQFPVKLTGTIDGKRLAPVSLELRGVVDSGLRFQLSQTPPSTVPRGQQIRWSFFLNDGGDPVRDVIAARPVTDAIDQFTWSRSARTGEVQVTCSGVLDQQGTADCTVSVAIGDGRELLVPLHVYVSDVMDVTPLPDWLLSRRNTSD